MAPWSAVTDEDHHVTSLAAPFLGSEWQTFLSGFFLEFSNESVALIHRRGEVCLSNYRTKMSERQER
jgi:hypothetical protein